MNGKNDIANDEIIMIFVSFTCLFFRTKSITKAISQGIVVVIFVNEAKIRTNIEVINHTETLEFVRL
jgi:hypothetical protein